MCSSRVGSGRSGRSGVVGLGEGVKVGVCWLGREVVGV